MNLTVELRSQHLYKSKKTLINLQQIKKAKIKSIKRVANFKIHENVFCLCIYDILTYNFT